MYIYLLTSHPELLNDPVLPSSGLLIRSYATINLFRLHRDIGSSLGTLIIQDYELLASSGRRNLSETTVST